MNMEKGDVTFPQSTDLSVYCVVVVTRFGITDYCVKGVESTGKTRLEIADEIEIIARKIRA